MVERSSSRSLIAEGNGRSEGEIGEGLEEGDIFSWGGKYCFGLAGMIVVEGSAGRSKGINS